MQSIILAATLLIAGITALPRVDHQILPQQLEVSAASGQPTIFDLITTIVTTAILEFANATPDPFEPVGPQTINYASPDGLLSVNCVLDGLRVTGASNLVINDVSIKYSLLSAELTFDVVYPEIEISASQASCNIVLDDTTISFEGGGTVTVNDIGIVGSADLNLLGGTFDDVKAQLTIGDIHADTVGTVQENDLTYDLNEYLNNNLLPTIISNIDAINQVISQLLSSLSNTIPL